MLPLESEKAMRRFHARVERHARTLGIPSWSRIPPPTTRCWSSGTCTDLQVTPVVEEAGAGVLSRHGRSAVLGQGDGLDAARVAVRRCVDEGAHGVHGH